MIDLPYVPINASIGCDLPWSIQTVENEILTVMLSGGAANPTSPASTDSPSGPAKATPLSYAQTGVYFDCMKNPTSTLYNTPVCLTFPIETDAEALKKATVQAVENHPALFVRFTTDESGVVQVMGDRETPVEVEHYTMNEEELRQILTAERPDVAFTRLWTMKEAVLKRTGEGLRNDLKNVFLNAPELTTVVSPDLRYVYSVTVC